MRVHKLRGAAMFGALLSIFSMQAHSDSWIPAKVEVFTPYSLAEQVVNVPPSANGLEVYIIDNADRLEQEASLSLPPITQVEAASDEGLERYKQRIVNQVTALATKQKPELESAWKGLGKATTYGLTRYPAVVINGEYVVYGVSVNTAVNQWRNSHAKN